MGEGGSERELRFAVAMNGGVSLAIWIGGATYELWRFAQRRTAWSEAGGARIDVMAGTSAGGINAALLAVGTLWPGGADDDAPALAAVRDLWLDLGGLEPAGDRETGLLRDPSTKGLNSLLDGEFFFQELLSAFEGMIPESDPPENDVEVDLQLPVTSLVGGPDNMSDAMGAVFPARKYSSVFHLHHPASGDETAAGSETASEPMGGAAFGRQRPDLARVLAAASRSTASFPFAFPPSDLETYLGHGEAKPDRSTWPIDGPRTRRMVDGGVLNNLPLDRAIEAVFDMPADGPVDRYLVVMVPDPAEAATDADEVTEPAVVSKVVVDTVLTIPRAQSVSAVLRELDESNAAVDALRAGRRALLGLDLQGLRAAADATWPSYRANRRAASARFIAAASRARQSDQQPLSYEEFERWLPADLPWVPSAWRAASSPLPECWGASAIRRMAATLLDLLSQAADDGAELGTLQRDIHGVRREASSISSLVEVPRRLAERALDDGSGSDTRRRGEQSLDDVRDRLNADLECWPYVDEPDDGRLQLRRKQDELGRMLHRLAAAWATANPDAPQLIRDLAGQESGTAEDPCGDSNCVDSLRALEIVQYAFRELSDVGEQQMKVGMLTPRLPCELDPLGRSSAETKLAGDELGHFGAFVKRSWRANDWMWGRLDAATFIGEVLKVSRDPDDHEAIDRWVHEAHKEIVRTEAHVICEAAAYDEQRGGGRSDLSVLKGVRPGTQFGDDAAPDPWENACAALQFTSEEPEREFLGRLRVGEEKIVGDARSPMMARIGTHAAATSLRVLKTDSSPALKWVSRTLRPVGGVADAASRYTRSIRPPRATPDKRDSTFLIGMLAILVPAAIGFADLLGFDSGFVASFAWIFLIGALMGASLIAPLTTVALGAVAALAGLAASLPDEPPSWMGATVRADDSSGWAWEWLPLQAWIAWIVILVALALIPLPIVGRIDIAWWRMRRRAQLTVFGWRQATNVSDAAADSDRDSATWTLVTACLLVAVPAAKFLPVDAATRQLVIVIGLAVAVAVRYGRQFPQAALSWQLANPRGTGAPGTLGSSGPLGRLALGAASLAVCVAAGVLIISEADDGAVFVALWMAMIPLVILLMWEIHRHDDWARHREISGDPPPDRAVLWTVGPAVTMFVAILMVGWMVRDGFDPDLVNATIDSTGDRLWFDDGTGRAISTLVVIGLGEEYVFRGLLFALAMTTPLRKFGFLAVSVSFALWHLDDAWGSTAEVLVVLAAAFMASHLALVPLRLRSRGLAGPVLLHTAVSSSILLVL